MSVVRLEIPFLNWMTKHSMNHWLICVSNMNFSNYVEEKILKPLGIDINKTGVHLSDFENINDIVKSYAYAPTVTYLEQWHKAMPQLNVTPIAVTHMKINN